MFIQTEATPNPATVKFLPGQTVLEQGSFDFASAEEASHSPIAQRLFKLEGVTRIFLGHDFISVSKNSTTDWADLKPKVLTAIMEHLSTGQQIVNEAAYADKNDEEDDEIVMQIKELLETRVRPTVMMDGGDIVFDRFEDGIVYLQMQGACAGCPSSTATLKMGVENMLKHFVPEVQEVRPVMDMSAYLSP